MIAMSFNLKSFFDSGDRYNILMDGIKHYNENGFFNSEIVSLIRSMSDFLYEKMKKYESNLYGVLTDIEDIINSQDGYKICIKVSKIYLKNNKTTDDLYEEVERYTLNFNARKRSFVLKK